jgi:hypothetical protein
VNKNNKVGVLSAEPRIFHRAFYLIVNVAPPRPFVHRRPAAKKKKDAGTRAATRYQLISHVFEKFPTSTATCFPFISRPTFSQNLLVTHAFNLS